MKYYIIMILGIVLGLIALWAYRHISGPEYLISGNNDSGVVIQFRSLGEYPCIIKSLCIRKHGSIIFHEECSDQEMHWDVSIGKTSDGIALNATGSAQGVVQKVVGPVYLMGEGDNGIVLQAYGSSWLRLTGNTAIEISL